MPIKVALLITGVIICSLSFIWLSSAFDQYNDANDEIDKIQNEKPDFRSEKYYNAHEKQDISVCLWAGVCCVPLILPFIITGALQYHKFQTRIREIEWLPPLIGAVIMIAICSFITASWMGSVGSQEEEEFWDEHPEWDQYGTKYYGPHFQREEGMCHMALNMIVIIPLGVSFIIIGLFSNSGREPRYKKIP